MKLFRCWVALVVVAAFPATGRAEPRYFPLDSGNRWTYTVDHGVFSGSVREVHVETPVEGIFPVRTSGPGEFEMVVHLAETDGGIFIDLGRGGLLPYHLFAGDSWPHRDLYPCDDEVTVNVVGRDEVVETPAGVFTECLRLDFQGQCNDAGTLAQWWAPEVGLVKAEEGNFAGTITWLLSDSITGGGGGDHRFLRGDANPDGTVDVSDMVYLLTHLFLGGPGPGCADAGDLNDDGGLNISDPVFGLTFLFLGGTPPPEPGALVPGYDGTPDDSFTCGDAAPSPKGLAGVSFDLSGNPQTITLAQAEAGVQFRYEVVIDNDLPGIVSVPLDAGGCGQPHSSGLRLLEKIGGNDQVYCLCDTGLCRPKTDSTDLLAGRYAGTFEWTGKNWQGPSDTVNPLGEPFPPGTYTFEIRAKGWYPTGDCRTCKASFEITGSVTFDLVP